MPYGITQCYLPPGRCVILAFCPRINLATPDTQSRPKGMQTWVNLEGAANGQRANVRRFVRLSARGRVRKTRPPPPPASPWAARQCCCYSSDGRTGGRLRKGAREASFQTRAKCHRLRAAELTAVIDATATVAAGGSECHYRPDTCSKLLLSTCEPRQTLISAAAQCSVNKCQHSPDSICQTSLNSLCATHPAHSAPN